MHLTDFLLLLAATFASKAIAACSIQGSTTITFYGYPDNSPPGAGVAYDCGGRNKIAGGSGTYTDPVTFASAPGEFDKCEIIYLPYLEKYSRMEDTCTQCSRSLSTLVSDRFLSLTHKVNFSQPSKRLTGSPVNVMSISGPAPPLWTVGKIRSIARTA